MPLTQQVALSTLRNRAHRAITRLVEATSEYAFIGSQPVEDRDGIRQEFDNAILSATYAVDDLYNRAIEGEAK